MSNKHPKVVTLNATVDDEAVAWSSLDHFYSADQSAPLVVAGGVLIGNDDLVARVTHYLVPPFLVNEVEVLPPGGKYTFTEGRDTPADVAAAIIAAGEGRALLDSNGWDALYASGQLDDDDDDDSRDDEAVIIH